MEIREEKPKLEEKDRKEAEEEKLLGTKFFKESKFEEALGHYEAAIEKYPLETFFYTNKAACLIKMEKFLEAISVCDQALEICNKNEPYNYEKKGKVYFRKASAYQQMKDYASAIDYYHKSLVENNTPDTKEALIKCKQEMKKK